MKRFVLSICLLFGLGLFSYAQNSVKANFGAYPADYELAFWNMDGSSKSKPPTVRKLFGDDAPFISDMDGIPVKVTVESASGNKSAFTSILLLTMKNKDKEVKALRMQIKFVSDSMAEKSYVRYIKIANLMSGVVSEQSSYGSAEEDANIMGFFIGFMQAFWDVTKF